MYFRRLRTHGEIPRDAVLDKDLELQTVGDEDDPLLVITAREDWATISGALARLTEAQCAVLLYRYVLGYSTEEVATLLGKRPKAIRALQSRALASLARHLGISMKARQRNTGEGQHQPLVGESSPCHFDKGLDELLSSRSAGFKFRPKVTHRLLRMSHRES